MGPKLGRLMSWLCRWKGEWKSNVSHSPPLGWCEKQGGLWNYNICATGMGNQRPRGLIQLTSLPLATRAALLPLWWNTSDTSKGLVNALISCLKHQRGPGRWRSSLAQLVQRSLTSKVKQKSVQSQCLNKVGKSKGRNNKHHPPFHSHLKASHVRKGSSCVRKASRDSSNLPPKRRKCHSLGATAKRPSCGSWPI